MIGYILYEFNGFVWLMGYIWLLVGVMVGVFMLWLMCDWLMLVGVFLVG